MALELILKEKREDLEDRYQFHKVNTGKLSNPKPLSNRQAAYHLLEFGYLLMKEAWRHSVTKSIMGGAAFDSVTRHMETYPSNVAVEAIEGMQEERPAQFLAFFNPMREYDGLVSDQKSLRTIDYVSLGGFPRIGIKTMVGIVAREASNPLQWLSNGTITVGLDLSTAWVLYRTQEEFRSYEKNVDKKMAKALQKHIKDGMPLSLREFEIYFASAFKTAIDALGGIERFKRVRENLYKAYEKLLDSGLDTSPISSKIAYFRRISDRKINLYDAISKLDIPHELETAHEKAKSNPIIQAYHKQ